MSAAGTRVEGLSVDVWAGAGGAILCVHATGFCKETWSPLVAELRSRNIGNPVVAYDQRGHGDSGPVAIPFDWWDLGPDALRVAGESDERVSVGIGHSSGAVALLIAELKAPGTFTDLILIEPIVFPPPYGRGEENPLSIAALKRRRAFASRSEALNNFRGRGIFAGWEDRALEAYVGGGFTQRDGFIELKCSPEAEAEFYRGAGAHGVWDTLGDVGSRVVVLAGERSSTHDGNFLADLTARFPSARGKIVPATTHFIPMERPGLVAEVVVEVLDRPND